MKIGAIVEGHGDEKAVPILVRRVAAMVDPGTAVDVPRPFRVSRGKLVKEDELYRAVELVARKAGPGAPILVVLDADDDRACELGPLLLERARAARNDRDIAVVVAVREYESWFLSAAQSLAGRRGLPYDLQDHPTPETTRGAKEWLSERMPNGYSETLDQPALTEAMDLAAARRADSFDKLVRDVARLMGRPVPAR